MGKVVAVSLLGKHRLSKDNALSIRLIRGQGVEGDAHCGETVKHRSRVRKDPSAPNLRQVHLIHSELLDELEGKGFTVRPGEMGENVTTAGVDLLSLPCGARLRLGESALIELTGLRNPCGQLNAFQDGLTAALLDRDAASNLVRKAGVMAIVIESGDVRPYDRIAVELPRPPHAPLAPV